MDKTPLISVIVPVYNVEKYLDRCLNSIVNQTYKKLEIILVDDGSPDKSPQMCDCWAKKDNRIKVIHKKNGGLGFARNSGLEIATGEYVAFVDSDDYIDTNMYQSLIEYTISNNADIVYCGHHYEKEDGGFVDIIDFNKVQIFERPNLLKHSLHYLRGKEGNDKLLTMSVWHSIYRRKIINTLFYSERDVVSEDLHFQISAIINSTKIMYIPHAYYNYCFNDNSLSHTFKFDKFEKNKRLISYILTLYRNKITTDAPYREFIGRTIDILRTLYNNKEISSKQKNKYYKKIGQDLIWSNSKMDIKMFNKHFKFLYLIFRLKLYYFIKMFMFFDYYIVLKKLKLRN